MRPVLFIIVLLIVGTATVFFISSRQSVVVGNTLTFEPKVAERPIVQPKPDSSGVSTYKDSDYGFILTYPPEYKVAKIKNEEADTFLLQDSTGTGMQIIVSPFDEPAEAFTVARVRQDLPDLPMRNVRIAKMPLAGIEGILFESSGGGFGGSVEFWFVHKGYLYQASTYLSQMSLFEDVMGTIRF